MLERDIEKKSVVAGKALGFFSFKVLSSLVTGLPDRCFIGHGRVVFIEFKTATGVLSKRQEHIHAKFARYGIKVHVCRTPDEAVDALFLKEIKE